MKTTLTQLSLLLLALALSTLSLQAQEKFSLSGYISDGETGETLIGATVYVPALQQGVTSNEYGFYSLTLPAATYEVEYSYVGFETIKETIELNKNTTLSLELGGSAQQLEEVVVTSEAANRNVSDLQMSTNSMNMETLKKLPALLGEVEVLRSIQLLPGVSTVGEGATGFNVRGGSIDQNLVLLDEAPVYNSAHLFGFFSVFNPDAVKDVELFKGGIPARYGGRLSSILDVRMKEGNSKKLAVNGGVGFIFSRLAVEAPIVKDKASFIVAARRSYIDVLAKPFLNDDLGETTLNFYDLTLKTNYKLNDNNQFFLSGYFGRDNFGFGDAAGFNWGNQTTSLRWNHIFSNKLFANTTLYYSNYEYSIDFGNTAENAFDWTAKIVNTSIKPRFTYYITPNNILRFGGEAINYRFEPANAFISSDGETQDISLDERFALEGGVYVENEQTLGERWQLNYGVRWSYFGLMGKGNAYTFGDAPTPNEGRPLIGIESYSKGELIQDFNNFEPRAAIKYQLSPDNSIKASYNRTAQYIHLLSNTVASTPVDIWLPSTNNVQPQMSDQFAIGYFQNFKDNTYETSIEFYYKNMDHQIDYIDGADLVLNEFVEGQILEGDGRAYGMEVLIQKNKGKFTGWASYTLGRSERLVEGINNDEWYPNRFDQTHNFSLTTFYELSKRLSVSAVFVYNTGTPATFPTSRYTVAGYTIPHVTDGSRNNVRIPSYHRLDLSATLEGKRNEERRWQSSWVFSVYNVYNRRNPFSIYFQQASDRIPVGQPATTEAVRFSVVGNFIPSIAYNFKF
ncbi:TonB-dependent receptor [Lewinella sp. LCG006]|uniref:TonB-dependent receptor n=1 Tax=Lewinella sp. LCG006 TaxID=3231911 RepID=UPI00345F2A8B